MSERPVVIFCVFAYQRQTDHRFHLAWLSRNHKSASQHSNPEKIQLYLGTHDVKTAEVTSHVAGEICIE